jgi:recombination protein RecT
MTSPPAPAAGKVPTVIDQFRHDLERMGPQFAHALPAHIPVERFNRVVMTAIQNNPPLLKCTRQSLFNACMKAASDGLLPDGREGVIIPFGETGGDQRRAADQAGWLPMIAGIRKKARNSGELADLYAYCVHKGDAFDIQLGDDPRVIHKPALTGGRTREIIGAYSIAVFKDGTKSYGWMNIDEIEDVRKKYSRSKRGPWSDPVAYPEMCIKTVVKNHAKSLPMSSDLDTVLRRDDELYDFKAAREHGKEVTRRQPRNAMAALEQFAPGGPAEGAAVHDGEHADDAEDTAAIDAADPRGDDVVIDHKTPMLAIAALIADAEEQPPQTPVQFTELVNGLLDAAAEVADMEMITAWWTSAAGRAMRNKANMTADDTSALAAKIKALLAADPLDIPAALRRDAK